MPQNVWNLGSFVSWWFDGFFEMTRFALGRLQFELMDFPESYEKDRTCAPEGMTKVINMHIPSCGPLKKRGLRGIVSAGGSVFADAFPGEEIAFFCESWLLYPRHREFLSPDSGIVQLCPFLTFTKRKKGMVICGEFTTGNMMETRKPCRRNHDPARLQETVAFGRTCRIRRGNFLPKKRKKCCKRWCTGTGKVPYIVKVRKQKRKQL